MILVTGATGYLGDRIVRALRAAMPEQQVVGLGRSAHSADHFRQVDLGDVEAVRRTDFSGVSAVVHCAGAHGKAVGDYFANNVVTTHNLLERLPRTRVQFAVLVSSMAVYGGSAEAPEIELVEGEIVPTLDPYGRSKLAQEYLLRAFMGENLCILRPSAVYGRGMAEDNLLKIWWRKARCGEDLEVFAPRNYHQNYVHVDDVAAIVASSCQHHVGGTYNVFSEDTLGVMELAELLRERAGGVSRIVDRRSESPFPRLLFRNHRVRTAFNFSFRSLSQCLVELDT